MRLSFQRPASFARSIDPRPTRQPAHSVRIIRLPNSSTQKRKMHIVGSMAGFMSRGGSESTEVSPSPS
jgi:hypothetical protein